MPIPCGGITSCSGQGFSYILENPDDGAINASSLVMIVDGDTITSADTGVTVTSATISYSPPVAWNHGDTIVFWVDYVENINGCASATDPCTFVVDIVPPVVVSPIPDPGDTFARIEDAVISAILFDDFSGVDTSIFSEANVVVTLGPTVVTYDSLHWSDSLRFTLFGVDYPGDGHYTICVNDVDDSPDYVYCPPNHLEQWCWDFYIISIERNIWFGDTCAMPCSTAYIPLYIDDLSGTSYLSLDVWFHFNYRILTPSDLFTTGVVAPIAVTDLDAPTGSDSIWHLRIEWADTVTGLEGGIIVWLRAITSCQARGGDFTSVIIDSALINSGYPRVSWMNGFFYALWQLFPWLHDINVDRYGASLTRRLTVGANGYATRLYDVSQDLLLIEPPPDELDAFITMDDDAYPAVDKLQRSIQGLDVPDKWIIRTDTETLAVVHWNPNHFPDGRIEMNGVINMKLDTMFIWDVTEMDSLIIEWYLPDLRRNDVALTEGWNLISLPYVPTHQSAATAFPGTMGAWGYNGEASAYFNAAQFDEGLGYWLYAFSDTSYNIVGTPVERYERLVYEGWNLLGSTVIPVAINNACTSPSGELLIPLYGWNGTSYIAVTDSIIPGRGYWAMLLGDAVASVPSGGIYCRPAPRHYPEWLGTVNLLYQDSDEILLFGFSPNSAEGIDGADEVFPPSPPDAIRLNKSRFRRDIFEMKKDISSAYDWCLVLDEAAKATISVPDDITLILMKQDESMYELNGTRTLDLEAGIFRICSTERANVPQLALLPNYPNPFNSATIVSYTMPKREKVQITVHDISGRHIATLLNDEMEPGFHSVQWSSGNAPSGIYIVRLSSPSGNRTMRTMLVK